MGDCQRAARFHIDVEFSFHDAQMLFKEEVAVMRTNIIGVPAGALICALWLSPAASAQQAASGIAGVVKDTSGAVMPGVTVEAASPALIEKVRSVVSDAEGRYNIVDLRPGT